MPQPRPWQQHQLAGRLGRIQFRREHDNHVHGLRIRTREHGCGELELDIDYIVEWLCQSDGTCAFRVAPATLIFRDVSDLRIEIDYAASPAISPFQISEISREAGVESKPAARKIDLNWTKGSISFSASGFMQVLGRSPMISETQGLQTQGHVDGSRAAAPDRTSPKAL